MTRCVSFNVGAFGNIFIVSLPVYARVVTLVFVLLLAIFTVHHYGYPDSAPRRSIQAPHEREQNSLAANPRSPDRIVN